MNATKQELEEARAELRSTPQTVQQPQTRTGDPLRDAWGILSYHLYKAQASLATLELIAGSLTKEQVGEKEIEAVTALSLALGEVSPKLRGACEALEDAIIDVRRKAAYTVAENRGSQITPRASNPEVLLFVTLPA